MQLGMVGLGRMVANTNRHCLMRGGHERAVFDLNPENVRQLAAEGAVASKSAEEFVASSKHRAPRG